MTAIQQRAQVVERAREGMLADVEGHKAEIERFLVPMKVDYEFFVAGLRVFLMRQQRESPDFFTKLTDTQSFIESLLRIAMNGLIPDGKEAAIAVYAGVAQALFMRDGFVKVLWRTGMVKSINDQIVTVAEYEAGRFEYEEGDQGFVSHRMDLMRKDVDPVAAAYCVIELTGGGMMREVVPKDELDKIAKMSKSPARGAWAHQMSRKAAIRRIMGKMPREKQIVQLLQHDEAAYDLNAVNRPAEDAPSHSDLLSNRPIRAKRQKAEPLAIEQGADLVVDIPMEDRREREPVERVRREAEIGKPMQQPKPELTDDGVHMAHCNMGDYEGTCKYGEPDTCPALAERTFILQAVITTKNGLQQFPAAEAEFWFGDLTQKLKTLEGDALASFWKINRGYIEEAGRNGYGPYAMRLLDLAMERGVEAKPDAR